MAKSTRSVLKSYKKQYQKSQNSWKKKTGFSTKKKPAFYDKYNTSPKPYKPVKSKLINTKYYMQPDKTKTQNENANNNGCYIATCVYGSYDCPEVWTLRRFRDYTLDKTWHGRMFIKFYYAISPILVKWFGKKVWFRRFWKHKLDILVSKLKDGGIESTKYIDKY